jgi:hypothetical protein
MVKRRSTYRKKQQKGGGLGAGYGFNGPSRFDTTINNPVVQSSITSCRGVEPMTLRPGFLSGGVSAHGLPGMSGGKRMRLKKLKKGKSTRRVQRGGRYGFDPSLAPTLGGAPWGSSYAPISAIPCESSRSQIPLSGASGDLNIRQPITSGPQSGGSAPIGYSMAAGVPSDFTPDRSPGSGSPGMIAETARYTDNAVSPIQTAAGGQLMIHTPLNASQMNPACLKTGGGSRKRKGSRRSKNRRSSKKVKKSMRVKKH